MHFRSRGRKKLAHFFTTTIMQVLRAAVDQLVEQLSTTSRVSGPFLSGPFADQLLCV